MRHWLQLGTRNWRAKPGRSALSTLAIALGVAVVVWVTGCYASVQRKIEQVVLDWIGRAHIIVESRLGRWGLFSDALMPMIEELPEVRFVTARTIELMYAAKLAPGQNEADARFDVLVGPNVEITGILPDRETLFRTHVISSGHMLARAERDAVLLEDSVARQWGVTVGDELAIASQTRMDRPRRFRVVGLVDRRRASARQAPMLWAELSVVQEMCDFPGKIKGLDVMLHDASPANVRRVAAEIAQLARTHRDVIAEDVSVSTTEAQLRKLQAAQGLLRFVLMLSACVLLLTAFFIIAATMNMSVHERVRQIGLMRCVGVTRRQTAGIVLAESLPIGLLGLTLGVPGGWVLQLLTMRAARGYIGEMAFSPGGHALAVGGGLLTALLAAALPALRALRVGPVEATRPHAHPPRRSAVAIAGAAGLVLLLLQTALVGAADAESEKFEYGSMAGILLLYAGWALLAPAVVVVFGEAAVRLVAGALFLRRQLLGDEVGKAPWRSAAICCGLMVGLSLIVGLVVWAESIRAGWQFPREFPEALVYSWRDLPLETARELERMPGLKDVVIADDFGISFRKPRESAVPLIGDLLSLLPTEKFARFVAVEPRRVGVALSMTYLEGSEAEAIPRLEQGGHVLITRELSQAQNKHVGNKLTIYVDGQSSQFTVAGVVASPAIDIAINFFNATEYFQLYAVGAVFGSRRDAREKFGRNFARLIVFNFDPDAYAVSVGEDSTADDARHKRRRARPAPDEVLRMPTGQRHPFFGREVDAPVTDEIEEAIVARVRKHLGGGDLAFATAAQLKRQIDDNLNNVTLLLGVVPLVGLLVAALGVGNLMMANVESRRREIAVLRALGTTRGLVLRMILGEAVILGVLGAVLGVGLGFQLAHTSNTLTEQLSGFRPVWTAPWLMLSAGAALAVGLCILAGWIPAWRASRSNIVAALQ
ncbi:MAG: ABC transporter permease [Phycisphaerae bacterium]|nr:ABC transporter permease [Phycisphaerae bacterium]